MTNQSIIHCELMDVYRKSGREKEGEKEEEREKEGREKGKENGSGSKQACWGQKL